AGGGLSEIAPSAAPRKRLILLDLRFLEGDVLLGDGVVLAELELLGRGPRVLLGHVEIAGVGGADQSDHNGRLLGHGSSRRKRGADHTRIGPAVKGPWYRD